MIHYELSLLIRIKDAITTKAINSAQIIAYPHVKYIKKNTGVYAFTNLFNTSLQIKVIAPNYKQTIIDIEIGDASVYENIFLEPINSDKNDIFICAKEGKNDIYLVKNYEIELIKPYLKDDLKMQVATFGTSGIEQMEMAIIKNGRSIVFIPKEIKKFDDVYTLILGEPIGIELSEMSKIYYVNRHI